jgi:ribose 1,5-bisphosphokinase
MAVGAGAGLIGPGRLVVVVGPSGAGKDTLITLARTACADDPRIVFPRRIVTRDPSDAEDHDSITPPAFDAAAKQGDFAFWWQAHGLKYALPAAIDAEMARGNTVVCNVSRGAVDALRVRYARVRVVLVTAPRQILLARLAARGREDGGEVVGRVERAAPTRDDLAPDLVIENVGDPRAAAQQLVAELQKVSVQ